jgi:hypothetical protein
MRRFHMSVDGDRLSRSRVIRHLALTCALASSAAAQSQTWIRQIGSAGFEAVLGMASDGAGGTFVVGEANWSLGGPHLGNYDIWVARYDDAGDRAWIRQFGTTTWDSLGLGGAAPDGAGGLFLVGTTGGSLAAPFAGWADAWVARFDGAGSQLWARQFGSVRGERAYGAAADGSGGVYVCGETNSLFGGPGFGGSDAWLLRYDSNGVLHWFRKLGSDAEDVAYGVTAGSTGNVYVCGQTLGPLAGFALGGWDAWLACFDAAGNELWRRQFGTDTFDEAMTAAPDGWGGVYVAGRTWGNLGGTNAGFTDAWLARYDAAGARLWTSQMGLDRYDRIRGSAADGLGGVYVVGETDGPLCGPFAGWTDGWLAHYDSAGVQTWTFQLGTDQYDGAYCAAPDAIGGVYVGGGTAGSLAAPFAGSADPWFARYPGGCYAIPYCAATPNSQGCIPVIGSSGQPSATAGAGFVITGSNVLNGTPGLLLYGFEGQAATPFGHGTLCLAGPTRRTPGVNSGGSPTGSDCSGVYSIDFNAFVAGSIGGNPPPDLRVPGTTVDVQWIGRDPGFAWPDNTVLSAGLHLTICP